MWRDREDRFDPLQALFLHLVGVALRVRGPADVAENPLSGREVGRQHRRDRRQRGLLIDQQREVLVADEALEVFERYARLTGANLHQLVEGALADLDHFGDATKTAMRNSIVVTPWKQSQASPVS